MNQPAAVEKLQVELGMYILVVTVGQAPLLHSHLYFVKLLAFVTVVHISFSHSNIPSLSALTQNTLSAISKN